MSTKKVIVISLAATLIVGNSFRIFSHANNNISNVNNTAIIQESDSKESDSQENESQEEIIQEDESSETENKKTSSNTDIESVIIKGKQSFLSYENELLKHSEIEKFAYYTEIDPAQTTEQKITENIKENVKETKKEEKTFDDGLYRIKQESNIYKWDDQTYKDKAAVAHVNDLYSGYKDNYYPNLIFIRADGGIYVIEDNKENIEYDQNAKILPITCISQLAQGSGYLYGCVSSCMKMILNAENRDPKNEYHIFNTAINTYYPSFLDSAKKYGNIKVEGGIQYNAMRAAKALEDYYYETDGVTGKNKRTISKGRSKEEIIKRIKQLIDENHHVMCSINFFGISPSENYNDGFKSLLDPKEYFIDHKDVLKGIGIECTFNDYLDQKGYVTQNYDINNPPVMIIKTSDISDDFADYIYLSENLSKYYDPETQMIIMDLEQYSSEYIKNYNKKTVFTNIANDQHAVVITGYGSENGIEYFYAADPYYPKYEDKTHNNKVIFGLRKWETTDVAASIMNSGDGLFYYE